MAIVFVATQISEDISFTYQLPALFHKLFPPALVHKIVLELPKENKRANKTTETSICTRCSSDSENALFGIQLFHLTFRNLDWFCVVIVLGTSVKLLGTVFTFNYNSSVDVVVEPYSRLY